jgi:hypothetical protein
MTSLNTILVPLCIVEINADVKVTNIKYELCALVTYIALVNVFIELLYIFVFKYLKYIFKIKMF